MQYPCLNTIGEIVCLEDLIVDESRKRYYLILIF